MTYILIRKPQDKNVCTVRISMCVCIKELSMAVAHSWDQIHDTISSGFHILEDCFLGFGVEKLSLCSSL